MYANIYITDISVSINHLSTHVSCQVFILNINNIVSCLLSLNKWHVIENFCISMYRISYSIFNMSTTLLVEIQVIHNCSASNNYAIYIIKNIFYICASIFAKLMQNFTIFFIFEWYVNDILFWDAFHSLGRTSYNKIHNNFKILSAFTTSSQQIFFKHLNFSSVAVERNFIAFLHCILLIITEVEHLVFLVMC